MMITQVTLCCKIPFFWDCEDVLGVIPSTPHAHAHTRTHTAYTLLPSFLNKQQIALLLFRILCQENKGKKTQLLHQDSNQMYVPTK